MARKPRAVKTEEKESSPEDGLRLDRWLWYARFLKSRTLAAKLVETGRLRVNGDRVAKSSRLVRPDDILTFPLGANIRVIKIVKLGSRRGPAPEAAELFEDLDPPQSTEKSSETSENKVPFQNGPARDPGQGRPTKRERRQMDAHRKRDLD